MNIVVGSAFRNSAQRIPAYFNQVESLAKHLGELHNVRVVAAEGDSIDRTRPLLLLQNMRVQLVDTTHRGPMYGSTTDPARMQQLSKVGNSIFDAVLETDDVLVYVESDLYWDAGTIAALIDMAFYQINNFDVFAPLVFAGQHFYDVWAFRKDGEMFSPFSPYHRKLNRASFTEVDSVGSCLVMRSEVARKVPRMTEGALVEWCKNARESGYRIAVHSAMVVSHPC